MTDQSFALAPGGVPTVAPFLVLDDAAGFVDFACEVFATTEVAENRTPTPDGRLIRPLLAGARGRCPQPRSGSATRS